MTLPHIPLGPVQGLSYAARVSYIVKHLPSGAVFTARELGTAYGIDPRNAGAILPKLPNVRTIGRRKYPSGSAPGWYMARVYEVIA